MSHGFGKCVVIGVTRGFTQTSKYDKRGIWMGITDQERATPVSKLNLTDAEGGNLSEKFRFYEWRAGGGQGTGFSTRREWGKILL